MKPPPSCMCVIKLKVISHPIFLYLFIVCYPFICLHCVYCRRKGQVKQFGYRTNEGNEHSKGYFKQLNMKLFVNFMNKNRHEVVSVSLVADRLVKNRKKCSENHNETHAYTIVHIINGKQCAKHNFFSTNIQ